MSVFVCNHCVPFNPTQAGLGWHKKVKKGDEKSTKKKKVSVISENVGYHML